MAFLICAHEPVSKGSPPAAALLQALIACETVRQPPAENISLGTMAGAREAMIVGTAVLRTASQQEEDGREAERMPSCCEAIDNPLFEDGLRAPVGADHLGLPQGEQHMGSDGGSQQGLTAPLQPVAADDAGEQQMGSDGEPQQKLSAPLRLAAAADTGAASEDPGDARGGDAVISRGEQRMGSHSAPSQGLKSPSPMATIAGGASVMERKDTVPACLMPGQQAEPSLKPSILADAEEAGPAAGASSDCHPTKGGHHSGPPLHRLPEQGPSSQGQLALPDVPAIPGLGDAAVLQGEQQHAGPPHSAPQQGHSIPIQQPVAVYVPAVPEVSDAVMACFMAGWHGGPSVPEDVRFSGQVAPPDGQLGLGQAAGGGGAVSGHSQQQPGVSSGAVAAYEMRYAGSKKKSAGKRPGFR